MRWEYRSEMVLFEETDQGLVHPMGWLEEAGREEWDLVSAAPLIAPNADGVAYGTIGILAILKRALEETADRGRE
ncbi:MAG TPA: hypothetical protein VEM93_08460 [Actinomycetota bacterium]|nr:hypothetical protein [Actinomycetota bacterium]